MIISYPASDKTKGKTMKNLREDTYYHKINDLADEYDSILSGESDKLEPGDIPNVKAITWLENHVKHMKWVQDSGYHYKVLHHSENDNVAYNDDMRPPNMDWDTFIEYAVYRAIRSDVIDEIHK